MNKRIKQLIPQYKHINDLFRQIGTAGKLSLEQQNEIANFYSDLRRDRSLIEEQILNTMGEGNEPKRQIIRYLSNVIEENITKYKSYRKKLDIIDSTDADNEREVKLYQEECKEQTRIVNQYYKRLLEEEKTLETIEGWRHDGKEIEEQKNVCDDIASAYDYQREILVRLQKNLAEAKERDCPHTIENHFKDIVQIGKDFLSLIEICSKEERSKGDIDMEIASSNNTTIQEENIEYFSKRLLDDAYYYLKNEFEKIPKRDFCANLNLRPSINNLKIKDGCRVRVYYIIYKLKSCVKKEYRNEWSRIFQKNLGVSPAVCSSKYKEAVKSSSDYSRKDFIDRIRKTFGKL